MRELVLQDIRAHLRTGNGRNFLINVLSLAGIVFSMQVYDPGDPRSVISYPVRALSFGVLSSGAVRFFTACVKRVRIWTCSGKRADMRAFPIGYSVTRWRLRNGAIPRSTGSFWHLSQLRELERDRRMITSSTLATIVDLPFFSLCLL